MNASTISAIEAEYGPAIEREIATLLESRSADTDGFYAMMRHQLGLTDTDPNALSRARPYGLFCLLACQAVGGSVHDAMPAGAAIELLASWFRAHADVELHTAAEQGRPALWVIWGDPQAINTGDGMFPLAAQAMLEVVDNPNVSFELTRAMADTALVHMEGQYLALTFQDRQGVSPEEQVEMIARRMGALCGYSTWAGAVIGGAGDEIRQTLRVFGAEVGTAWLIRCELAAQYSSPATGRSGEARTMDHSLMNEQAGQRLQLALAALAESELERGAQERLAGFARELTT